MHTDDMILEIQRTRLLEGQASALAHPYWQRIFNYAPEGAYAPLAVSSTGLVALRSRYIAWAALGHGTHYITLPF